MGDFIAALVLMWYLPDLIEVLRDIAAALREGDSE